MYQSYEQNINLNKQDEECKRLTKVIQNYILIQQLVPIFINMQGKPTAAKAAQNVAGSGLLTAQNTQDQEQKTALMLQAQNISAELASESFYPALSVMRTDTKDNDNGQGAAAEPKELTMHTAQTAMYEINGTGPTREAVGHRWTIPDDKWSLGRASNDYRNQQHIAGNKMVQFDSSFNKAENILRKLSSKPNEAGNQSSFQINMHIIELERQQVAIIRQVVKVQLRRMLEMLEKIKIQGPMGSMGPKARTALRSHPQHMKELVLTCAEAILIEVVQKEKEVAYGGRVSTSSALIREFLTPMDFYSIVYTWAKELSFEQSCTERVLVHIFGEFDIDGDGVISEADLICKIERLMFGAPLALDELSLQADVAEACASEPNIDSRHQQQNDKAKNSLTGSMSQVQIAPVSEKLELALDESQGSSNKDNDDDADPKKPMSQHSQNFPVNFESEGPHSNRTGESSRAKIATLLRLKNSQNQDLNTIAQALADSRSCSQPVYRSSTEGIAIHGLINGNIGQGTKKTEDAEEEKVGPRFHETACVRDHLKHGYQSPGLHTQVQSREAHQKLPPLSNANRLRQNSSFEQTTFHDQQSQQATPSPEHVNSRLRIQGATDEKKRSALPSPSETLTKGEVVFSPESPFKAQQEVPVTQASEKEPRLPDISESLKLRGELLIGGGTIGGGTMGGGTMGRHPVSTATFKMTQDDREPLPMLASGYGSFRHQISNDHVVNNQMTSANIELPDERTQMNRTAYDNAAPSKSILQLVPVQHTDSPEVLEKSHAADMREIGTTVEQQNLFGHLHEVPFSVSNAGGDVAANPKLEVGTQTAVNQQNKSLEKFNQQSLHGIAREEYSSRQDGSRDLKNEVAAATILGSAPTVQAQPSSVYYHTAQFGQEQFSNPDTLADSKQSIKRQSTTEEIAEERVQEVLSGGSRSSNLKSDEIKITDVVTKRNKKQNPQKPVGVQRAKKVSPPQVKSPPKQSGKAQSKSPPKMVNQKETRAQKLKNNPAVKKAPPKPANAKTKTQVDRVKNKNPGAGVSGPAEQVSQKPNPQIPLKPAQEDQDPSHLDSVVIRQNTDLFQSTPEKQAELSDRDKGKIVRPEIICSPETPRNDSQEPIQRPQYTADWQPTEDPDQSQQQPVTAGQIDSAKDSAPQKEDLTNVAEKISIFLKEPKPQTSEIKTPADLRTDSGVNSDVLLPRQKIIKRFEDVTIKQEPATQSTPAIVDQTKDEKNEPPAHSPAVKEDKGPSKDPQEVDPDKKPVVKKKMLSKPRKVEFAEKEEKPAQDGLSVEQQMKRKSRRTHRPSLVKEDESSSSPKRQRCCSNTRGPIPAPPQRTQAPVNKVGQDPLKKTTKDDPKAISRPIKKTAEQSQSPPRVFKTTAANGRQTSSQPNLPKELENIVKPRKPAIPSRVQHPIGRKDVAKKSDLDSKPSLNTNTIPSNGPTLPNQEAQALKESTSIQDGDSKEAKKASDLKAIDWGPDPEPAFQSSSHLSQDRSNLDASVKQEKQYDKAGTSKKSDQGGQSGVYPSVQTDANAPADESMEQVRTQIGVEKPITIKLRPSESDEILPKRSTTTQLERSRQVQKFIGGSDQIISNTGQIEISMPRIQSNEEIKCLDPMEQNRAAMYNEWIEDELNTTKTPAISNESIHLKLAKPQKAHRRHLIDTSGDVNRSMPEIPSREARIPRSMTNLTVRQISDALRKKKEVHEKKSYDQQPTHKIFNSAYATRQKYLLTNSDSQAMMPPPLGGQDSRSRASSNLKMPLIEKYSHASNEGGAWKSINLLRKSKLSQVLRSNSSVLQNQHQPQLQHQPAHQSLMGSISDEEVVFEESRGNTGNSASRKQHPTVDLSYEGIPGGAYSGEDLDGLIAIKGSGGRGHTSQETAEGLLPQQEQALRRSQQEFLATSLESERRGQKKSSRRSRQDAETIVESLPSIHTNNQLQSIGAVTVSTGQINLDQYSSQQTIANTTSIPGQIKTKKSRQAAASQDRLSVAKGVSQTVTTNYHAPAPESEQPIWRARNKNALAAGTQVLKERDEKVIEAYSRKNVRSFFRSIQDRDSLKGSVKRSKLDQVYRSRDESISSTNLQPVRAVANSQDSLPDLKQRDTGDAPLTYLNFWTDERDDPSKIAPAVESAEQPPATATEPAQQYASLPQLKSPPTYMVAQSHQQNLLRKQRTRHSVAGLSCKQKLRGSKQINQDLQDAISGGGDADASLSPSRYRLVGARKYHKPSQQLHQLGQVYNKRDKMATLEPQVSLQMTRNQSRLGLDKMLNQAKGNGDSGFYLHRASKLASNSVERLSNHQVNESGAFTVVDGLQPTPKVPTVALSGSVKAKIKNANAKLNANFDYQKRQQQRAAKIHEASEAAGSALNDDSITRAEPSVQTGVGIGMPSKVMVRIPSSSVLSRKQKNKSLPYE